MAWPRIRDVIGQRPSPPAAELSTGRFSTRTLRKAAVAHASQLFSSVMPVPFQGEIFLAGGAFKPLIKEGHAVRDLDLWVRDRRVRERLCDHLVRCGATLVRDFRPYCILLRAGAMDIEVTYQNVKDRPISEILEGFDLAPCGIAATYVDGQVTQATITPAAIKSLRDGEVLINKPFLRRLETKRTPDVLQGLDRVARFASEMGMAVPEEQRQRLWAIYEELFTHEERQACVDTYMKATVEYKGHCDVPMLQRASSGFPTDGLEA